MSCVINKDAPRSGALPAKTKTTVTFLTDAPRH
jgi:hypothetical protein